MVIGSRTCNQQVAGSNPGRGAAGCNPGQVVYTHVHLLSKQHNLVPVMVAVCRIVWVYAGGPKTFGRRWGSDPLGGGVADP